MATSHVCSCRKPKIKILDDEAKISGLENKLRAAREENDALMRSFEKVAEELTKDHPDAIYKAKMTLKGVQLPGINVHKEIQL